MVLVNPGGINVGTRKTPLGVMSHTVGYFGDYISKMIPNLQWNRYNDTEKTPVRFERGSKHFGESSHLRVLHH
jgi:hypothetical protein